MALNSAVRSLKAGNAIDLDALPDPPTQIGMYVCGPTVYQRAHIGNARPVIVFDVLFRLLRQVYGAAHVTYARNITDVDDKINAAAQAQGVPISTISFGTDNATIDLPDGRSVPVPVEVV